jgi:hypothetical protein
MEVPMPPNREARRMASRILTMATADGVDLPTLVAAFDLVLDGLYRKVKANDDSLPDELPGLH